jgi:hypothetical protein
MDAVREHAMNLQMVRQRRYFRVLCSSSLCLLLAACAPYPLAYYAPAGFDADISGLCKTPHSFFALYLDPQIEVYAGFYGSITPQLQIRIKDDSVVRFFSSTAKVTSSEIGEPLLLSLRTQRRDFPGGNVAVRPVTEIQGPVRENLHWAPYPTISPDHFEFTLPQISVGDRVIQVPTVVLAKARSWTLVGPCQ